MSPKLSPEPGLQGHRRPARPFAQREMIAEAGEQVQDMLAEVQAEDSHVPAPSKSATPHA